MRFVNISGTAKKIWLGVRLLRETKKEETMEVPLIDTYVVSEPSGDITSAEMEPIQGL